MGRPKKKKEYVSIDELISPVDVYETEAEKRAYIAGLEEGSKKGSKLRELVKEMNNAIYAEGQIRAYEEVGKWITAIPGITKDGVLKFIRERVAEQSRFVDQID